MGAYTMQRGDNRTFTESVAPTNNGVQVLGSNGIQGWSFWLTVKKSAGYADSAAVFQKIPSQWQITQNGNATTPGLAFCNILPADTASLPPYRVDLIYDVQAKDASGNIFTLESGTWTVLPDVTISTVCTSS